MPGTSTLRSRLFPLLLLATLPSLGAAGLWDDPENLEVLPADISPDELRATMRGFATHTGSRCSHCHVGEVETDLSTYDFSLDDKAKKRKARKMIRLVNDINQRLQDSLGEPESELVKVTCATCHRGQAKPEMIQDVLARAYAEGGIDKATADYKTLRDRYYGAYTFDFSERALIVLGERYAESDEPDAAIAFLDLNLEYYPASARSRMLKGQVLAAGGDKGGARKQYEKVLELQPDNRRVQQLLQQLGAG